MSLSSRETSVGPEATLREVVEALAAWERRAGSADEQSAAIWLGERLHRAGVQAEVEEVEFLDGYALLLLPLGLAGVAAAVMALSGRRLGGTALAAAAAAALIDDVSNRRRIWRRLIGRRKRTWNVVARAGDPEAETTLVVLAHHDAAPTGRIFDQSLQRWLARRFPTVVARIDTSLPIWWPTLAGPTLAGLGALLERRRLVLAGAGLSAAVCAVAADVARSPIVPGANDNLSGVAALVALAERLGAQPPRGLAVLLVSCGAEEVLQGGIYGFRDRHLLGLDPEHTRVLNLDTIGSPQLIMLEGEGPFRMEEYCDPGFRDLIEHAAGQAGMRLRRGCRARSSTDAVIPSRAGYPTATLVSWEPDTKLLSNYHLPSDTPENLRYDTVARAVELVWSLCRALAS